MAPLEKEAARYKYYEIFINNSLLVHTPCDNKTNNNILSAQY